MSEKRSLSEIYIDTKFDLRRLWEGELDPLAREHLNHALAHLLEAGSIEKGFSSRLSAQEVHECTARSWKMKQRFHNDPVDPEVCDG